MEHLATEEPDAVFPRVWPKPKLKGELRGEFRRDINIRPDSEWTALSPDSSQYVINIRLDTHLE